MLYFVATPIGNLKEVTLRALEVLESVDLIYAENPRHSLVLLNEYDIKKSVYEYQKWNERAKVNEIIKFLQEGKNIAIISDAGMPIISDPGGVIVPELIKANCEYTVVSGPCALINAVILSGFDASSFCMLGFLPQKKTDRVSYVQVYKNIPSTLVFYVSIHDVDKDLDFLFSVLGERKFAVVREISKKFETVVHGVLGKSVDIVKKGELVIVVEGAALQDKSESFGSIKEHLMSLVGSGLSRKEAVKLVASERGEPKSVIYSQSIDLEFEK